jgi:hypothetical protein
MKMIILSLLLVIAFLIHLAPDIEDGKANVTRVTDQYEQRLH